MPAVLGRRPRWQQLCVCFAITGWLFHFVSFVEMLSGARHLAALGLHEVQSTLSLLIATAFMLVWIRYKAVSFGMFAMPLALLLALVPALGPDRHAFSSPFIRSGWIFVHVTTLLAAYASLIFSMIASILYLVQERRMKNKETPGFLEWLPPLDTMDQIAQTSLVVGFCCMTVGLLAGSLIAQEHIGAAYFLDPKVLLSFVMWILYVVLLFVRRSTGLRGRRAVYLSSAVFIVMLSVWAANLLSSVHRFSVP
ncbi:cytochrome C assembly family protein [Acidipila rosea]|uniref:cytochrome C assembly family protein n=1 Tax=Acidipila rosea TaxID=768535 RepID=UPI00311FE2B4